MDDDQVDVVLRAVERTGATRRARVSLEAVSDCGALMDGPEMEPAPWPRLGDMRGLLNWATSVAVRLVARRFVNYGSDPRRALGFVEFESRRSAIDYGAYAQLVDGRDQWDGRSGRALATLGSVPEQAAGPLWLFDLLRGVTDASHMASEAVRERVCEHLRVRVDIARVSAARPDPTPLPPGSTFEGLGAVPVDVWLDDEGFVRRIRFEYRLPRIGAQACSLELFDFGTSALVDWSRLPVFTDPRTGAPIAPAA